MGRMKCKVSQIHRTCVVSRGGLMVWGQDQIQVFSMRVGLGRMGRIKYKVSNLGKSVFAMGRI